MKICILYIQWWLLLHIYIFRKRKIVLNLWISSGYWLRGTLYNKFQITNVHCFYTNRSLKGVIFRHETKPVSEWGRAENLSDTHTYINRGNRRRKSTVLEINDCRWYWSYLFDTLIPSWVFVFNTKLRKFL